MLYFDFITSRQLNAMPTAGWLVPGPAALPRLEVLLAPSSQWQLLNNFYWMSHLLQPLLLNSFIAFISGAPHPQLV
jgi:hypothetical protein